MERIERLRSKHAIERSIHIHACVTLFAHTSGGSAQNVHLTLRVSIVKSFEHVTITDVNIANHVTSHPALETEMGI